MEQQSPRMHVSVSDGVTVVTLANQKILDEVSISRLGEDLGTLVGKSPNPRLVIDFVNVTNMSSSALGMLITLHKRVRESSGQLRLCNIQPNIMEVFRITRLEEIFDIYQSQHEATDGLK